MREKKGVSCAGLNNASKTRAARKQSSHELYVGPPIVTREVVFSRHDIGGSKKTIGGLESTYNTRKHNRRSQEWEMGDVITTS